MKTLASFIKSNLILIIVTVLSVFCVFYFKTECYCTIIKNVSYSIIAAFIFYVIIDYIPFVRKKKIMRNIINMQLSKLYGHIDQCVNRVISPFNLDPKIYKNKDEFTNNFANIDLEEKGFISSLQTRKSYLESHKEQIINIIEKMLDLHSYLSYRELENLTYIAKSTFLTQPIVPQMQNLSPEYKSSYPNNQREIGESIYEIYELIKGIKQ